MGSFVGHVIPGTFFLVFGSWWIVQIFRRYFQTVIKNPGKAIDTFQSTPTFPVTVRKRQVQLEAIVVIFACSLGIIVEIICAPIYRHGPFFSGGNLQHATMYFFFAVPCFATLILPCVGVIRERDMLIYVFLAMAYLVEGLLFNFHLYGRDAIDVLLHTLLVYTVYTTVIVVFVEAKYRSNVILPILRAYLTILQGTWFWQVALIMYPPLSSPWSERVSRDTSTDHDAGHDMGHNMSHDMGGEHAAVGESGHVNHESLMLYTCIFTWYMGILFILVLTCGAIIGKYYKAKYGIDESKIVRQNGTANGTNEYSKLQASDVEEEV